MFNGAHAVWKRTLTDNETGEVLFEDEESNIVVSTGRALSANCLFGLSASATIVAIGAGACGTIPATVTDTHLNYELINGSTQRKTLTDTSGNLLTSADVVAASFSDTYGEPYYKKITAQCIYNGASDPNVNQPFQEFGLFTTTTLPATPTSTSGTMFSHYVNGSSVTLTSTTTLTVQVTLYW